MKKLLLIAIGLFTISNLYAGFDTLIGIEYECKIGENTQIVDENFKVPGARGGVHSGYRTDDPEVLYKFGTEHARNKCAKRQGELIKILTINNKPFVEKG